MESFFQNKSLLIDLTSSSSQPNKKRFNLSLKKTNETQSQTPNTTKSTENPKLVENISSPKKAQSSTPKSSKNEENSTYDPPTSLFSRKTFPKKDLFFDEEEVICSSEEETKVKDSPKKKNLSNAIQVEVKQANSPKKTKDKNLELASQDLEKDSSQERSSQEFKTPTSAPKKLFFGAKNRPVVVETSPPTEDAVPVISKPGIKDFQKQVLVSSPKKDPIKFSISPKEPEVTITSSPSSSSSPQVSPIFLKKRAREEPQQVESEISSSSSDFESIKTKIPEQSSDINSKKPIEPPKTIEKSFFAPKGVLVVDKRLFAKKETTQQNKEAPQQKKELPNKPPTPEIIVTEPPKKTVKFVEVISDSSTDAFEEEQKKINRPKPMMGLLAVPSKKIEKKRKTTEKRGLTKEVVPKKSKKEDSSKKMKQLNLSKFFSGVKSPVKKLNVPYKETIIPNPAPSSWAMMIRPFEEEEERPHVYKYFEGTFSDIQLDELQDIHLDAILLDPPWALDGQPNDGYSITPEELVKWRIHERFLNKGLLFIWVEKELILRVIKMAAKWGFAYVENLAWVKITPNNKLHTDDYKYFTKSKLTLLIFKKGGKLELRHQRNPDVIFDFIKKEEGELQESKPDQVYTTIETLLPNVKKGETRIRFAEFWCRKGHVRDEWVSVHYVKSKSDEASISSQQHRDSEDLDFDNVDFSKFIVTEDIEETESVDKSEEEVIEDSPNELVDEIEEFESE